MEFNLKEGIAILERTPKILEALLLGLSEDWVYSTEGQGTWSAFDVVGHLIHGEKTDWIVRLKQIMSDDENRTFNPFDRFAQFEASKGKTIEQLIAEFTVLRQTNLSYLNTIEITETDLQRRGNHPDLGEVTLKQLLATWVTHDLGHIAQISRVMAKQYRDEVGPWRAYISILNK